MPETLDCILDQTRPPDGVVVVSDGDMDGTDLMLAMAMPTIGPPVVEAVADSVPGVLGLVCAVRSGRCGSVARDGWALVEALPSRQRGAAGVVVRLLRTDMPT
jgi:hypothetical protein